MARVTLQETRVELAFTARIADLSGISVADVYRQASALNDRLQNLLHYETPPITITQSGAWRVDGVSGVLRLNDVLELEVVPKFLNAEDASWRADFFLIAVLVRTGHLLATDEVSAQAADRGDLATLIARALIQLCASNERRPLRNYRATTRVELSLDGEVDWESVALPDSDGFRLQRLELSRENTYNATIKSAVELLEREVAEGDTRIQLQRLARRLGPQAQPRGGPKRLPPRHQGWQAAYDVARLVIEGKGLDVDGSGFVGPGFVLSTWESWQALCEEVMRRAIVDRRVIAQMEFELGQRPRRAVVVKPDLVVLKDNKVNLLLDAKYKTRADRRPSISSADLYESLAFLLAASTEEMFLLYPAVASRERLAPGEWQQFDDVTVGELKVKGFEVQVQGLSERGGFQRLVTGARSAVLAHERA